MLYGAYFKRVYGFALKRLGDPAEAEDVTQEVFITLLDALPSYQGQSSLLVWIFGVTRNKVNRRFRRVRPHMESLDEEGSADCVSNDVSTEVSLDARRLLAQCQEIVETELSPLQKQIFQLKHAGSMSIRGIAGSLGKSEDAVKAQLYRIRRLLAERAPGAKALLQA